MVQKLFSTLYQKFQVVVIDPVVLSMEHEDAEFRKPDSSSPYFLTCPSHDYDMMKPIVLASWRLAQHSASKLEEGRSEVIAEARVLQENIQVPNSGVSND